MKVGVMMANEPKLSEQATELVQSGEVGVGNPLLRLGARGGGTRAETWMAAARGGLQGGALVGLGIHDPAKDGVASVTRLVRLRQTWR